MNFNLTVTLTATPELLDVLNRIAGGASAAPKQITGKVADMKVSKPAAENGEVKEKKAEQVAGTDAITIELIADTVKAKISSGKVKAVKKLLEKYNVPKATALEQSQYEEFLTELKAV